MQGTTSLYTYNFTEHRRLANEGLVNLTGMLGLRPVIWFASTSAPDVSHYSTGPPYLEDHFKRGRFNTGQCMIILWILQYEKT